MDDLAQQAEEAAAAYNTRELYNLTKIMAGKMNRRNSMPVRDNDGKLLSKEDDQMNRWKEHFQQVLNRPTPEIGPELADNDEELSISCARISKNEIKNAVKKLKNGRRQVEITSLLRF